MQWNGVDRVIVTEPLCDVIGTHAARRTFVAHALEEGDVSLDRDDLHRSRRLRFPETLYRHHGQEQEESDDDDVQQVDR